MLLSKIAHDLGIEYSGEDQDISAINTLTDATSTQMAFLDNAKYEAQLATTKAAAVLVHPKQSALVPKGTVALITHEPYVKLALASKFFAPKAIETSGKKPSIAPDAYVASSAYVGFGAIIGARATVMPGVFIGDNAVIGEDTVMYPNVTVYRDCVIGARCIIHASAVIGSDGFGFAHTKEGVHVKIYQNGNVIIEDDVEIGSNTSIDRAVFASTLIQKGTKIDNLVQIGHNVVIEQGVIIASQVGISGSTTIGHHSVFGGQSGVVGHLTIAPMTTITARCGVMGHIKEPGLMWAGFPHQIHREWLKIQAKMKALLKK